MMLQEIRNMFVGVFGSFVITVTVLLWRPRFPRESKVTLMGADSPGAITFLDGATAVQPHDERTLRITNSDLPSLVSVKI